MDEFSASNPLELDAADLLRGTEEFEEPEWEARTAVLLGDEAVERLHNARVAVVGVGGVGGYAVEVLVRSGVGHLTIVDADDVAPTNINRQLVATHDNVGQKKVFLFAERIHDINPEAEVEALPIFLEEKDVDGFLARGFDFVVDAIDTVAPKVALIEGCIRSKVRFISSMGAGGRIDPSKVCYEDIWSTTNDGLARAVRQKLKAHGIKRHFKVVASTEIPRSHALVEVSQKNKRTSFGTLASIPAIFGIYLANHAIRQITGI